MKKENNKKKELKKCNKNLMNLNNFNIERHLEV